MSEIEHVAPSVSTFVIVHFHLVKVIILLSVAKSKAKHLTRGGQFC